MLVVSGNNHNKSFGGLTQGSGECSCTQPPRACARHVRGEAVCAVASCSATSPFAARSRKYRRAVAARYSAEILCGLCDLVVQAGPSTTVFRIPCLPSQAARYLLVHLPLGPGPCPLFLPTLV